MSLNHAYRYPLASHVAANEPQPHLVLATSNADGATHPYFFEGRLREPRQSAELLSALHRIVAARFFVPANTRERAIALADPVVTSGGGLLRFEGFSGCCSTYARVDLLPESYDGELVGSGTTNVDFNAPMRAALARIRDADGLALSVGRDEVALRSARDAVVERKVELPLRWLRGMLEVQSYQASMRARFSATSVDALRFFRTLPKASTSKTPLWIARGASGLFTTTQPAAGGVRVADTSRLRVIEPLLPKARALTVFADDAQQASAWVLELPGARFTLALSAEVWRGFSGEGQALRALLRMSDERTAPALAPIRAQLRWQSAIEPAQLGAALRLDANDVADTLRILGVSGLVGYDVFAASYFHRELPFDLSLVDDMHPRLRDAKELLAQNAVTVATAAPFAATVQSGDTAHHVRERDGLLQCTCPWFAKHQGDRGPCKHVLAVEAFRSGSP